MNHPSALHESTTQKMIRASANARCDNSYTRRFVNVTLTGGKRKMNPNPGS
jgi:Fe-S cluster assembly ATPase SufC